MFAATNMMFAGGLDPVIKAFKSASGATDLAANDALARYIRAQGLMPSTRCFPFKAAQNAGSGSTVYGWGDLTANNCTLVASPTWGAGGVAFNGTTQFARVSDFTSSGTITVFCRTAKTTNTTGLAALFAQYDTGAAARSIWMVQDGDIANDPWSISRSADGGNVNIETYKAVSPTGAGADICFSAQWVSGGERNLWVNKTSLTISLSAGSSQTERFNSSSDWTIGAALNSNSIAFPAQMTATCVLFIQANITQGQRETITDLINAL